MHSSKLSKYVGEVFFISKGASDLKGAQYA